MNTTTEYFPRRSLTMVLALAAATMLLAGLAATNAKAAQAPKLVQVYYAETNDGSSRPYALDGFARRATSMRFSVRIAGERVNAKTKLNTSVTDTDLKGDTKHPWQIVRDAKGKAVLKKVRKSLDNHGSIVVRVRTAGNGGVDKDKVRIVLSECSQNPPLYPVSCEIKP